MASDQTLTALQAMKMAIEEARKGAGFVAPNPLVGCVILDKDQKLLAKGYHRRVGEAHAEVEALRQVKDQKLLKGAHLYVTLEPCAHEGRTPSCAKTLAQLPLASVTYGLIDPNPLVAGQGVAILKNAGIVVREFSELKAELEELAEIFLHNMQTQKPFVALKAATTLDGQMAMANGESQWITSESSRQKGHYLRGCYDAILVGSHTVKTDDPSLNVRHPQFPNKPNQVVILDPNIDCDSVLERSKILAHHDPTQVWWIIGEGQGRNIQSLAKVNRLEMPVTAQGEFDLDHLMAELFAKGICSIYVEGGARTYGSFLRQQQAQRLYLFVAPSLIGAGNGLAWTSAFSTPNLKERVHLNRMRWQEQEGGDLFVTGRLQFTLK